MAPVAGGCQRGRAHGGVHGEELRVKKTEPQLFWGSRSLQLGCGYVSSRWCLLLVTIWWSCDLVGGDFRVFARFEFPVSGVEFWRRDWD